MYKYKLQVLLSLKDPRELEKYLGGPEKGALSIISTAWYKAVRPNLPEDIRRDLEKGRGGGGGGGGRGGRER